MFLPWVHESLLDNIDVLDAASGDNKIRVRVRNMITHN